MTSYSTPKVIIDVLSESTEKYDRGMKLLHYRQVASVKEYVLVSQNRPLVERYVRQPNGRWELTEFAGLNEEFSLETIPVYAGVEFPEFPAR